MSQHPQGRNAKWHDVTRCASVELDDAIRDLIERRASPDPGGVAARAAPSPRRARPPQAPGETSPTARSTRGPAGMSSAGSPTEHLECAKPSRGKTSTNFLEQKIRCLEKQRKELLEVNQRWDQQFRSMRELYERKVTELKTRLDSTERLLGTLDTKRPPSQRPSGRPGSPAQEPPQCEEKETQRLREELRELKKDNELLKEENALASRRKERYECEIKRLNQALQDALDIARPSFAEDCVGGPGKERGHEAMRTEMELLRQQVQIYEEDFKRERSDRERLSQEKELLQRINQTSQSRLNKLKSQIKACQMEKEKLEKQLKQTYSPAGDCGLGFRLQDPHGPGGPEAAPDLQKLPISGEVTVIPASSGGLSLPTEVCPPE